MMKTTLMFMRNEECKCFQPHQTEQLLWLLLAVLFVVLESGILIGSPMTIVCFLERLCVCVLGCGRGGSFVFFCLFIDCLSYHFRLGRTALLSDTRSFWVVNHDNDDDDLQ